MVRFAFTCILLIHSLIHLLGFVKEFRLANVSQLTGKTLIPFSADGARFVGGLWLLTCFAFIVSIILFLLKKEGWWRVALIAVLFSQTLIILYWQDAKFGTIANIIICVGLICAYGSWNFNTMIQYELKTFLPKEVQAKKIVREEMLQELPPVVQKWLRRSNLLGKELIYTVHLNQVGKMKTSQDGKWMPVKAEQYFTVDKPGFIWVANVQAVPFMHLSGRDKYENGKGHMLIKLLSLFPVADAKGKETDQGTLLRYLAETVWFPSAALSNYITWEENDSTHAKATMQYGDITASGIFSFTPKGDVMSLEAQRYYDRNGGATLETWFINIDTSSYTQFEGIRVPAKSAVTWKLKDGDFTWYKLEVSDIKYNETIEETWK